MGTFGRAGAFSFYATKTITTGEGGMLVTDDDAIADRARVMSLHGISRDAWNRYAANGSWYYEIEDAGYKYNMTDIAAALGWSSWSARPSCSRRAGRSRRPMRGVPSRCRDVWNSRRRTGRVACLAPVHRPSRARPARPRSGRHSGSDRRPRDWCERSLHSAPLAPVLPAKMGQPARGPRGHRGIRASHLTCRSGLG